MAYRILILVMIIAVNGFFAASEVALVSVRRSRLRALADEGQVAAQAALNLLANPARLLSVTQVGVTLASLALGWAGEDTVYQALSGMVRPLITPATAPWLHGASFAIAFLIITWAHVIVGEVVPKNLAIEKADRLALLAAPALLVFYRVSEPFVYVIERSARALSRMLGLRGDHSGGGHSPEELKFIVSVSRTEGHLRHFEEDAIQAMLELQNYSVRQIMTPRNAIVSVPVDAGLERVLRTFRAQQFTRVPVYEGRPEHIIGYIHYKDLIRVWEERKTAMERKRQPPPFRIRNLLRKALVIPETKSLDQLIDEFRNTHVHMATVVDEFGTIVGLVTLEDVLEQIFGEIGDEHDVKRTPPTVEPAVLELDGATLIRDLDTQYGIELPSDAGFETLAGFLLFQFGAIPSEGDRVDFGGRRFTIARMEGRRIARVRIEKLRVAPSEPDVTGAPQPPVRTPQVQGH
ncbi:MAG TPA: hemolysin family protein [Bryobacteraceae bacterium]|nr:hemolysin family protein [Bryobacteraceae bacterium]